MKREARERMASRESWWIGVTRGELNAEAARRFPSSITAKEIGPILKPLVPGN
jgi:hypothetical protein